MPRARSRPGHGRREPASGRRGRWIGGWVWLASLGGCGDDGDTASSPPPAKPDPAAFQAEAQRRSYDALLPVAESLFAAADPVSAAALGRGPIAPVPVAESDLVPLREALERASEASQDLAPRLLEPEPAAVLRAVQFGISRLRDHLLRRAPWRSDPGWTTREVERALEALHERRARGDARAVDQSLAAIGRTLTAGIEAVTATSTANLGAAQAGLARIDAALARFPATSAREEASGAVASARARLDAIAEHLPDAQPLAPGEPLPLVRDPAQVRRLPDRLGAAGLRRLLEVEEALGTEARQLYTELGVTLGLVAAMQETHPAPPPGPARPVTAERCEAAWARVRAMADRQPLLRHAALDCPAFVAAHASASLTDGELVVAVLEQGVVERLAAQRREDELPVLALLAGRFAPPSQRAGQTLALAVALADEPAIAVARERVRAAACTAAAALWIHGELGPDETLVEQLEKPCPAPARWIEAALPAGEALRGVELRRLGLGPAHVVALDRYPWMPAGLIDRLAQPRAPMTPGPAPAVRTEVVPLGTEKEPG